MQDTLRKTLPVLLLLLAVFTGGFLFGRKGQKEVISEVVKVQVDRLLIVPPYVASCVFSAPFKTSRNIAGLDTRTNRSNLTGREGVFQSPIEIILTNRFTMFEAFP